MMLAACSNDPLGGNDNNGGGGFNPSDATRNFLTVTVVPTSGMGTRADDESASDNTTTAPKYEDGTEAESNVQFVRFFFFNAKGEPAPVWENSGTGGYNSFIDWYPNSSDIGKRDPNETVEKVLHTTLGLVIPSGYDNPASVLAVVNPTTAILALDEEGDDIDSETPLYGPSLGKLNSQVADYLTGLTDTKTGNFVMSNSVYVDNSKVVNATALGKEHFSSSLENTTPVTIYVERVLARLDFGLNMSTGKHPVKQDQAITNRIIYPTSDEKYSVDGQNVEIYVEFLGWNVTGTADQSRLVKSINADWTNETLFGDNTNPWNTPDYHRSFWALNPDGIQYQHGDFDGSKVAQGGTNSAENFNPANKLSIPQANEFIKTYLQENANAYSQAGMDAPPTPPTKVIIAAQLVNAEGDPYELAEWAYQKYTLPSLKARLAENELSNLYYVSSDESTATVYKQISVDDFEFKTAAQLREEYNDKTFAADDADYFVYVVLSNAGKQKTWYLNPNREDNAANKPLFDAENAADKDADNIKATNKYIYNCINRVRVWKKGRTYYYFDVKHLGDTGSPAEFGIVRNHIYRATVTKVEGLGTPVYDPGQIIIPEPNEYEESIVTADVKILQWRVVENNYELVWP